MSDEPQPEAKAAAPPDPPATTEAADALETVACPLCGAVLRNVKVEPGARVCCLNCGKRFVPEQGQDARATAGAGVARWQATPAIPATGIPRGAGYWLWRIPATIACTAALVLTPFLVKNMLRSASHRPMRFEDLVVLSYVPLLSWAGLFLVFLTRSLARNDEGAVALAWHSGMLKDALPKMPGSSLPYIAPVAVAGGLLPAIMIRANPNDTEAIMSCGGIGGLLFYLGFALEDLRQFTWRQESLARACYLAGGGSEKRLSDAVTPHCGMLLAGTATLVALGLVGITASSWYYRGWYRDDIIPVFCSVALVGASCSLYLLGRGWDRAVAWWELAAANAEGKGQTENAERGLRWRRLLAAGRMSLLGAVAVVWTALALNAGGLRYYGENYAVWYQAALWVSGLLLFPMTYVLASFGEWQPDRGRAWAMLRFCCVPFVWIVYGALWITLMCVVEGGPSPREAAAVFLMATAVGFFAAWLAVFLAQVRRWRDAQERFWAARPAEQSRPGATQPPWQGWLIWGAVALCSGEAVLFSLFLWDQNTRYMTSWRGFCAVLGFPLLLALMHYPTMWVALLVREFLTLERLYQGARDEE
ncbi:MAG: hypothetical protein NTW87_21115 [Planctomycetota bacterium]|nr:hypothetical protein [Planctomycetota bacterium]